MLCIGVRWHSRSFGSLSLAKKANVISDGMPRLGSCAGEGAKQRLAKFVEVLKDWPVKFMSIQSRVKIFL
ncbi:hypothetical protein CARN8_4680002 [mine drainage metagenome]|uniref:Uncharacterized protein n=1 Tax=mine drainage metagenome TaxID=410659 RepID=A0A3P3ZPZ8_9ZZZZ